MNPLRLIIQGVERQPDTALARGEMESVENYRGTSVKMDLTDKVMLDIAVSDPFVEITMEAVLGSARTGEVGDGLPIHIQPSTPEETRPTL